MRKAITYDEYIEQDYRKRVDDAVRWYDRRTKPIEASPEEIINLAPNLDDYLSRIEKAVVLRNREQQISLEEFREIWFPTGIYRKRDKPKELYEFGIKCSTGFTNSGKSKNETILDVLLDEIGVGGGNYGITILGPTNDETFYETIVKDLELSEGFGRLYTPSPHSEGEGTFNGGTSSEINYYDKRYKSEDHSGPGNQREVSIKKENSGYSNRVQVDLIGKEHGEQALFFGKYVKEKGYLGHFSHGLKDRLSWPGVLYDPREA